MRNAIIANQLLAAEATNNGTNENNNFFYLVKPHTLKISMEKGHMLSELNNLEKQKIFNELCIPICLEEIDIAIKQMIMVCFNSGETISIGMRVKHFHSIFIEYL